jgi:hypothetical protein
MVTGIRLAVFSYLRCRERVGWERRSSMTKSPQMKGLTFRIYSIIHTRAGCPIAFIIRVMSFYFPENKSVFDTPTIKSILQYCD